MRIALLFLLVTVLLGGCMSNTPTDLALGTIQEVDWRDQDELPGPGASYLLSFFSKRQVESLGESVAGGPKPSRPLLKIEFTSATNVARYITENAYWMSVRAYFCDQPGDGIRPGHDFIGLSHWDVYWRGERIAYREDDPIGRSLKDGDTITYYFYANVARSETILAKNRGPGFDLRREPRDICFYLLGGNNTGFGFLSNTVVVPKEAIRAALPEQPQ